jgi:hypothetical protein
MEGLRLSRDTNEETTDCVKYSYSIEGPNVVSGYRVSYLSWDTVASYIFVTIKHRSRVTV